MKKLLFFAALTFVACNKKETKAEAKPEIAYATFGDSISADGALSKEEMLKKFAELKEGDTLDIKFESKINDVCQKKGCWMKLDLANDNEAFVKFKDYAFFMPLNSKDEEVIVKGKAFVSVESVDELKHYAKDGGATQAAIDSITQPKTTYSFMADGVLMKK